MPLEINHLTKISFTMRSLVLFLLTILIHSVALSQTYKVTYHSFFEGKERQNFDPIWLYSNPSESYIVTENIVQNKKEIPFEIQKTDWKSHAVHQFAFLKDAQVSQFVDSNVLSRYNFTFTDETKEILGYPCKKAVTSINSNTMEVWYTEKPGVKGGPSNLGQNLGLVLEIVRNGNSATRAIKVEKIKSFDLSNLFEGQSITTLDELSHRDRVWQSRFTILSVFENEVINFSEESKSDEVVKRFANGTIILKRVKYPTMSTTDNVFVELWEQSRGDAYDRTGTVFVITEQMEKSFFDALSQGIDAVPVFSNENGKKYKGIVLTSDFAPATELMRFFTPFGVDHFNHLQLKGKTWMDKVSYRQDITELSPLLSGKELWTGVFIGNYDKGGHEVSLEVTVHNNGMNVFQNDFALPIFNTLNIMEMAGQDYSTLFSAESGLTVQFTLDKPLKNAQLRYITTGHGGWEHGDEFVPKANHLSWNGTPIISFVPWRTECGSYRLYNPASGNFSNGLSSSDLSRSNWCPATVTNPNFIALGDLSAGEHRVQVQIPQGENQGNSFSSWNVSGVLIGTQND